MSIKSDTFFLGALYLIFAFFLQASWLKWGNISIDTFHDPLAVRRMLSGEIPYKDFIWEYGFGHLYVLFGLCRVFSFHLNVFIWAGVIVTALIIHVIYQIARLVADETVAFISTLGVLVLCAFGHYSYWDTFNFILPYVYASIFLLLFVLTGVWGCMKFIHTGRLRYILYWVAGMTAAFLTRPEYALIVWLGFGFIFVLVAVVLRNGLSRPLFAALFLPVVFAGLGYYVFLSSHGCLDGFRQGVLDHIFVIQGSSYNHRITGISDMGGNLFQILESFLLTILVVSAGAVFVGGLSQAFSQGQRQSGRIAFFCLGLLALIVLKRRYLVLDFQYKSIVAILLVGGVGAFLKALSPGQDQRQRRQQVLKLILYGASFFVLGRIVMNINLFYGFTLVPLGLVSYYVFLFELTDGVSRRMKYEGEKTKIIIRGCLCALFLHSMMTFAAMSFSHYRVKNALVTSEYGDIKTYRDTRFQQLTETVRYVRENVDSRATITVLPQDDGLQFFVPNQNTCRFSNALPFSIEFYGGEEKVIAELQRARPDYIILSSRRSPEWGRSFFGIDYGLKVKRWIEEAYEFHYGIGPYPYTAPESGYAIYHIKEQTE